MNFIPCNLQDIAAFVAIIQFIVVVIALWYTKGQLEEASRSRQLGATTQLLQEIGSPEIRKIRKNVLSDEFVLPKDFTEITDEQYEKATALAVAYDRVGYMVKLRLIPENALFHFQRDEIEMVWNKLKELIGHIQHTDRPSYCTEFKNLATVWLPNMKKKKKSS